MHVANFITICERQHSVLIYVVQQQKHHGLPHIDFRIVSFKKRDQLSTLLQVKLSQSERAR